MSIPLFEQYLFTQVKNLHEAENTDNWDVSTQFKAEDSTEIKIRVASAYPTYGDEAISKEVAIKKWKQRFDQIHNFDTGSTINETNGTWKPGKDSEIEWDESFEIVITVKLRDILNQLKSNDLNSRLSILVRFMKGVCTDFYQDCVHLSIGPNKSDFFGPDEVDYGRLKEYRSNVNSGTLYSYVDIKEIRKLNQSAKKNNFDANIFKNKLAEEFEKFYPVGKEASRISEFKLPRISEKGSEITYDDVLKSDTDFIINGIGGVGKSTIAKKLASDSIKEEGMLPLLIKGDDITRITKDRDISKEKIFDLSFRNLVSANKPNLREKYVGLAQDSSNYILLVDQLDDIEYDEYITDVRDLNDTISDFFPEDRNNRIIMFVRKNKEQNQYKELKIICPIEDIVTSLKEHGINKPELKTILETIQTENGNKALVRADIKPLVSFLNDDHEPFEYGTRKARYIPMMIYEETGIFISQSRLVLQAAISILFPGKKYIGIDELADIVKLVENIEDEVITELMNSSRMFNYQDDKWCIDTHDTTRDHWAANFYRNKKLFNQYCEKQLQHPLVNIVHTEEISLNRRILGLIAEKFPDNKLAKLLEIVEDICEKSSIDHKESVFENYFYCPKNNIPKDYLHKLGLVDGKVSKEEIVDCGVKIWDYFTFDNNNADDKKHFISVCKPFWDNKELDDAKTEIKSPPPDEYDSVMITRGKKSPIIQLLNKLSIDHQNFVKWV